MVRKKTGVDADGRHLLAVRFDRLEPGYYFAFHESGQVMYRKNGRGTADRGITTVHVSPEQLVYALGDVMKHQEQPVTDFRRLGLAGLGFARRKSY